MATGLSLAGVAGVAVTLAEPGAAVAAHHAPTQAATVSDDPGSALPGYGSGGSGSGGSGYGSSSGSGGYGAAGHPTTVTRGS